MTNFESSIREDFLNKDKSFKDVECNYQTINGKSNDNSFFILKIKKIGEIFYYI